MSQTSQDLLSSASQLSGSPASTASTGRKRSGEPLKGYHAPWETAPAHVIDLVNGRSAYGDKPLDKLWEYVSSETPILKWRTECPVYLCLVCVLFWVAGSLGTSSGRASPFRGSHRSGRCAALVSSSSLTTRDSTRWPLFSTLRSWTPCTLRLVRCFLGSRCSWRARSRSAPLVSIASCVILPPFRCRIFGMRSIRSHGGSRSPT